MSGFDHDYFQRELVKHFENRLGWTDRTAKKAADIASDVIRVTHGGERHYIAARNTPREDIKRDYQSGQKITAIAKTYALSATAIRNIIKQP
jgi:Mor family transcriptional regulator